MKKNIRISTFLFIMTVVLISCDKDYVGQYPTDNTAPQPISNVVVENLPGSVKLTYDIPDEKDLLYVKAEYLSVTGEKVVYKTSVYSNTMLIKGFGKSKKSTIKVTSVDRSQNESPSIEVDIEPLDSPIYDIFNNIEVVEAFGGIKLTWKNPSEVDIMIGIMKKDNITGELSNVENFYTSEADAMRAVRGLDTLTTEFNIYIRDAYMNYTDTLVAFLKPYYEEEVPKRNFLELPLSTYFAYHRAHSSVAKLWDNNYTTESGYHYLYIKPGNTIMPFFTFDMGLTVKLSRIKIWQRMSYAFSLYNAKIFECYGTNDETIARDVETLEWVNNPSWVKILDGESKRPSGMSEGVPLTNEDKLYAETGEDYEFDLEAPPVRFIRYKLIETWSGADGLNMMEIAIWGELKK